ncbi:GNAT family N-acetyltransferase [Pelagovum pacificum]|uniref:GNAT family N-acetyltransferase n=1 Tax=Pelagovum pacificum TaxID=2588711 RepID=A0A5C5GDC3_9RHOB|nr:GNAT family N-acetyltransferase [Pelagovum pacificum]QQA44128.1 GNAT family N-acetyltransferase [Pelagovum pacificum]TNY32743.1 GNAT family N-acetyltransferase [Pelagovum pacificum]
MIPRPATPGELDALAELWFDGWRDAHLDHVPAELTALRTLEDFRARLARMPDTVRVTGPEGAPTGFCAVRDNEIYQLFVAAGARGTGAAAALIADGEARIAAAGHREAMLDVVEQNARARRFYERCGWQVRGRELRTVDTSAGGFEMELVVMVKPLAP